MDLVEQALLRLGEVRVAVGRVGNVDVSLMVGYIDNPKFAGYELHLTVTLGSVGHKVTRRYFNREDAYKVFDELVKKYNLEEMKVDVELGGDDSE